MTSTRRDGPVDSTLPVAGLRKVRFHVWSSVGRFPSAAVDSKRVLHRDPFPYVRRKLIQQKRILLRARQRCSRGRVEMLITADDEAIGKIGIELEPLGLSLPSTIGGSLPGKPGSNLISMYRLGCA